MGPRITKDCTTVKVFIYNRFLEVIRHFLKAGVKIDGVVQPTEKGVPQGGVVSP